MSDARPYVVLMNTLQTIGERTDTDLPSMEHVRAPWESRVQATCECLSWRGALDNLERRQAEDRLGETVYRRFPVHTRSVLTVAHALMDKGVFTESELESKTKEVRIRLERDSCTAEPTSPAPAANPAPHRSPTVTTEFVRESKS